MEEDFLFYSLFRDQMGEEFDKWLAGRIQLLYRISEEVSGRGLFYDRARKRSEAIEIIRTDYRIYKFYMN